MVAPLMPKATAVWLIENTCLTFEQIAVALDISPNTAASRYRYGLDKLRGRLRPLYEEIKGSNKT